VPAEVALVWAGRTCLLAALPVFETALTSKICKNSTDYSVENTAPHLDGLCDATVRNVPRCLAGE
jgi:hypothetical protein